MLKKPDCLFIFSPGGESRGSGFDYHLGSAYIISYIKSKGFHAQPFISGDHVSLKEVVKRSLNFNARIIGFTVYNSNFNISVLIARQIKKLSPGTLIAFGGPCPSVHFEFIMETYPFVDVCFVNKSEESFLQFITKLSEENYNYEKSDLTGIKGISYRKSECVCHNPENLIQPDNYKAADYLDKYPSPYLTGIIPGTSGHSTGILTARGCNQNCVYCNCAVLSKRRFYTHSVGRVIEELDFISKQIADNEVLTFQDDAFTLIPQRAKKICNEIINNKIKISLGCITRCDCVDEALLDRMKEAGFVSIAFSLESINPEVLRRIGKVNVAEDSPSHDFNREFKFIESFNKMTAYAKKIGIKRITASIMVGLPGETINEAKRTIKAIAGNKNIDHYAHNFLTIYKGTPLFENHTKYGYKIKYINNNPIFPEISYPNDVVKEVNVSPKSNLHSSRKYNDKSTLDILSLSSEAIKGVTGFRSLILQSDNIQVNLVNWLEKVLTLNGIIIQIYSSREAMTRLSGRNKKMLIKYLSPSLNIINYCLREKNDSLYLQSLNSILLRFDKNQENIRICDFEYFRLNFADQNIYFSKTLCKESGPGDSISAYSYLSTLSKEKDPFSYLVNLKALPYFVNICKWTKSRANCRNRNTLIVNDKSEIRFCWYGNRIGKVGQTYDEIIDNFESDQKAIMSLRKCDKCIVCTSCIRCTSPYPLQDEQYCSYKKSGDVTGVAEMITGLDQIKQVLL